VVSLFSTYTFYIKSRIGETGMKSLIIPSMCFLLVLLVTAGCQPKLAESPYGAREQQWEEFIKSTYPDWKPPQTYPPERTADLKVTDEGPTIIAEDGAVVEEDEIIIIEAGDGPKIDKDIADRNIEKAEMEITSEFQTYTVQKGDTLWSISSKFYGKGSNWRKIFKANQDVISNPDKVKTGIEIRIPAGN
jgi:LysM repeat protein